VITFESLHKLLVVQRLVAVLVNYTHQLRHIAFSNVYPALAQAALKLASCQEAILVGVHLVKHPQQALAVDVDTAPQLRGHSLRELPSMLGASECCDKLKIVHVTIAVLVDLVHQVVQLSRRQPFSGERLQSSAELCSSEIAVFIAIHVLERVSPIFIVVSCDAARR